jgi:hypothetical protein
VFLPWKTASQTTLARLSKYNDRRYPQLYYLNKYLKRIVHQHITASDFLKLPEGQENLFKISFVRNPYDRAYSGFLQIQKDIVWQPSMFEGGHLGDQIRGQISTNREMMKKANYDFDAWINILTEEQVYDVTLNSSLPLYPAHYWTHINKEKYVDFIGKVENYENDLECVCKEIGVEPEKGVNKNITFTHSDTAHELYKYVRVMNSKSRDKINSLFRDDFELFGYEKVTK